MLGGFVPGQAFPADVPVAAGSHTETVDQLGTVVFGAPIAGITVRTAPRIDEVYVEAEVVGDGSGQVDGVYLEAESLLAAVARLEQVYVEAWTVAGAVVWSGWGIPF